MVLNTAPSGRARFSWLRLAAWLPACLLIGLLVGAVAALAVEQTQFAPLLFFPLLVGACLGLLLVSVMRFAQVAHRPTIVMGTLLAVLATVGMQHYMAYRSAVIRSSQIALAQQAFPDQAERLARGRISASTRFIDYMRQEASQGRPIFRDVVARNEWAWLTWGLDSLLVLIAALVVVLPALGLPYCEQCETWYHTTRTGQLPLAAAQQLATAAGFTSQITARRVRYRFVTCQSGCGPTRFELSWRERRRNIASEQAWLDPATRDRVHSTLDVILAQRPHKRRSR